MSSVGTRPPARKGGVPLSIRLVLATSIVVAGAVFASTYFNQRAIQELAAQDARTRRAEGMAAIERESHLLARNVATAVATPLGGSLFEDVQQLVDAADRDYLRIEWILVVDPDGRSVAASAGAPRLDRGMRFVDRLTPKLAGAAAGVVESDGEGTQWTYGTPIVLGKQRLGEVRVGVSSAELEEALAASLSAAEERARRARGESTLLALALLAVGVILAAVQGFGMARPLRALSRQAERIAAGDLDQRVPERRGDEIGALARSFNFMAGRLGEVLEENAQKASLERELSLARGVQQAMLPPPELVTHGPLRIVGHCVPASSCGGDWWTYRRMSGDRTLVVIGDATGHGIHSALIAATARGAVEALADADENLLSPEQVLRAIHAAISGIGEHSLLMTCLAVLIDPAAGTLHYANAGQNFPYVMRRGGDGALDEAQIIAASGNPLGDKRVPQTLRRGVVPMRAGDVLVMFTDGVVERANPGGKLFGDRRLRQLFRGSRIDAEQDLLELRERLVQAVDAFAEGTTAQDDLTFVLVQTLPAAAQPEARSRTGS